MIVFYELVLLNNKIVISFEIKEVDFTSQLYTLIYAYKKLLKKDFDYSKDIKETASLKSKLLKVLNKSPNDDVLLINENDKKYINRKLNDISLYKSRIDEVLLNDNIFAKTILKYDFPLKTVYGFYNQRFKNHKKFIYVRINCSLKNVIHIEPYVYDRSFKKYLSVLQNDFSNVFKDIDFKNGLLDKDIIKKMKFVYCDGYTNKTQTILHPKILKSTYKNQLKHISIDTMLRQLYHHLYLQELVDEHFKKQ